MNTRTAVLIHGCHLQADLGGRNWEHIVWGPDSEGQPTLSGRAVMGLRTAFEYKAELVIFSTGASERAGIKEGLYTHDRAFVWNDISSALARVVNEDLNQTRFASWLMSVSELDLESQNTADECRRNFARCAALGISRIILVSSPWHIQRCHTEALKVAQEMRDQGEIVPEIVAIASHGSTEGVLILEPPHRGDQPRTRWHEIIRRYIFRIPENKLAMAEHQLTELFEELTA